MANGLKFYNVPGISREDEPYFSNVNTQEAFFERFKVSAPVFGFYPPKFKDTITVDTLTVTTSFNYMSIEFNDKNFYYFISEIQYISEDVIEVSIELDVIQTYMFNMTFAKYHRVRESIPRWITQNNVLKINRDYIRENVSSGVFEQIYKKPYSKKDDFTYSGPTGGRITGWYIAKCNKASSAIPELLAWEKPVVTHAQKTFGSYKTVDTPSPYYFYAIPEIDNNLQKNVKVTSINWQTGQTQTDNEDFLQNLQDIVKNARCVELYYLPLVYPDNISCNYNETTHQYEIDCTPNYVYIDSYGFTPQHFTSGSPTDSDWHVRVNLAHYQLQFSRNTANNSLFSASYCPQLIDDNYMHVEFGEQGFYSTYPLQYLTELNLEFLYYGDITTGSRTYIAETESEVNSTTDYMGFENKYSGANIAAQPHYVGLLTDSWQQYWEYNKASLFVSVGVAAMKASTAYASWAVASESAQAVTNARYSAAHNSRAGRRIVWREGEATQAKLGLRRKAAMNDALFSTAGTVASALNSVFAPDIPKSQGTRWNDLLSGNLQISLVVSRTIDYSECAKYFETNGYLVNKEVSLASPFIRNRYYYDVVCCNELVFAMTDSPLTQELRDEIESRFDEGFRIWHTYVSNSVVYAYIEDRSLIIGSACVYDNVEV